MELKLHDATKFVGVLTPANPEESVMTKLQNRCSNCGGKFGLVSHHHWGLRFCRKACKDNFLAKTAKDYACMRRWFGLLPRGAA
jgi:ribosomal protein S14